MEHFFVEISITRGVINMKNFAKLSIKILSIYFLVEFISTSIPNIMGLLFTNIGRSMKIGMYILITSYLIKLIVALFLWYYSDKLSNIIFKDENDINFDNIDYKKIQLIAFSVVGVVLLAINIPYFIRNILQLFIMPGRIRISSSILQDMITKIIAMIIGGWLLFGSKWLVKHISN